MVCDILLLRKEMVSSNPVATLVSITNGDGTRKHPQAAHVTVATAIHEWSIEYDSGSFHTNIRTVTLSGGGPVSR